MAISISKLTKLKRLSKYLYNDLILTGVIVMCGFFGFLLMLKDLC
jgi:hypothetical protein